MPADLGALDEIARVDVGLAVLVAPVRDDEHHAHLAGGSAEDPNGGNQPRLLRFDPRGKLVEARAIERGAFEPRDLLLESGTEPAEVKA